VCLSTNAPTSLVLTADSTTLKLNNQKNGWKGVCVHQVANGESFNCPVRALARWVLHLRDHNAAGKMLLSSFFHQGTQFDVCGKDISKGLKLAATILQYPSTRGFLIECIDTHSLRSGGRERISLVRLLRHTNPEDGGVEGSHVQGIHPGGIGLLLRRNEHKHETKLQICQRLRQCLS
jgi:hypothetical protein